MQKHIVWKKLSLAALLVVLALSAGCATSGSAGPYYRVSESDSYEMRGALGPIPGPMDQTYVLDIDDRTPFGLYRLSRTMNLLYNRGYDQVRRERYADFAIDILFTMETRDDPHLRAWQTFGGALTGAGMGAIIGGALGDPGPGAAIGAASGGVLGAVLPAPKHLVRIDIYLHSFTEGQEAHMHAVVDLASVPHYEVAHVIDHQVSRMLRRLPRR